VFTEEKVGSAGFIPNFDILAVGAVHHHLRLFVNIYENA